MPGDGTFNLSRFFQAIGIKNPHPTVSERITPVLIAGDLSQLTPAHYPPTGAFGGDEGAVAAEVGVIEINSLDRGGCFIEYMAANAGLIFGIADPDLTGTLAVDAGPFSAEPILSQVFHGTLLVSPLPPAVSSPINLPVSTSTRFQAARPLYVPPGRSIFFVTSGVNSAITNWTVIVRGVPAAELGD